jgi:opacity protein-like surface antigen
MKPFKLLILLVLLAGTARADFTAGSQTISVFGGFGGSNTNFDYQPGNRESVTGSGSAFGAQYFYYLRGTPSIALGIDVASSLNGNGRSDDLLTGLNSTERLKSVVEMIMARLSYPHGKIRPYIFSGVGVHDSVLQLSAQPQAGVTWPGGGAESRMLVDERKTSAALGYGIGLDIFPTESLFFGLELRGVWLAGLNTDSTSALTAAGYFRDDKQDVEQGNIFFRAGVKF